MAVRRLTREQFDACFEAPMRRLDNAAHLPDVGPYIDEAIATEPSLQRVDDIHAIYRDAQGRVDQVLLETERDDRYLVLMVDVARVAIFGHFLIDLREEYGMDQMTSEPLDGSVGLTATLWRPVGPKELALIRDNGMRAFPPRLPEQPIFYPVTTEDYAIKIARDWNVRASGSGYVTRFEVSNSYLDQYRIETAGGRAHQEYWIPAEDLDNFNAAIVGEIVVTREFYPPADE